MAAALVTDGATDVSTGDAVLTLFGTGWRGRREAGDVRVTVGGLLATVLLAGAQPEFAGLDQINVRLPGELAGRGEVEIVVEVGGRVANPVRMVVR